MPVIGTFSAVKDGYAGTIRTLTIATKVRLIANDRKEVKQGRISSSWRAPPRLVPPGGGPSRAPRRLTCW